MPYSSTRAMRVRASAMRGMAETFDDPETKRLILAEADRLEAEAERMDQQAAARADAAPLRGRSAPKPD